MVAIVQCPLAGDIYINTKGNQCANGACKRATRAVILTWQLNVIKTRMERALAREILSREEILKRVDLQWPEEEKVALADFVIHNDGSEEELIKNITDIYKELV